MAIGSYGFSVPVVEAAADERAAFIRRTYLHLAGALALFALLEVALLRAPFTPALINAMVGTKYSWLIVLGAFMLVGHVANRWALSGRSQGMQYLGLGLYIVAEAVLFLPLIVFAAAVAGPSAILNAGLLTGTLFVGLTGTVLITRKDFSFMRTVLMVGGFLALGTIVASIVVGFDLGLVFSVIMVGLAGGYIIYYTSQVLHHYRTDQHVAAALALFAAVALMFWYVLRIFTSRR